MATPSPELPRGAVTFLFTDIEGSTDPVRRLGLQFGRVRAAHRRALRETFTRHRGHEVDTAGDGFFVAFEKAGDAVAAAVAAQREIQAADEETVRVRTGIHTRGEHRLKDIERPQRLFQLVVEGLPPEFSPLNTEGSRPAIVTLLLADLVGWRHVLQRLGDERATAAAYHDTVLAAVAEEGGRGVEVVADTVMAAFAWPHDALRAAVRIRERFRAQPWPFDADRPPLTIAVHSGRVADPSARHLGSVAYRCSTLGAAAEPGQVLVSHATEALLEGQPTGMNLRDLGERTLEGLDHPVRVFELQPDPA